MTDIHVHVHAGPQVSTSTKTTLAAEEVAHECGCPHRHTPDDKTVRPCEAKEATAPVIYEAASRTYAQARADILAHLQKQGWTVKPSLKIPHATDPTGEIRLWFKPQAIWYTAEGQHDFKNARSLWIDDIRKMTPEQFEAEVLRHLKHRGVAEMPGPLASAAGAAVGSVAAAALAVEEKPDAECLPWVKIGVDSAKYEACLAQAKRLGPITNAKAVYALVHKEFHRRDQECFIVIPCDIRGQLRYPPIEIAYGQRSRVSVGVADITRAAVVSGAEYVVICHGHPSGKANPSKADRDLTKAVDDALKKNDIVMADHCVIGRGEVFSIKENKLHKI